MGKPTVGLLVVVTAIPAMLIAADGSFPQFLTVSAALLGTFLTSSSSAVFNQLIDQDIDNLMYRTKQRPLPSSRISTTVAWTYGLATLALGLGMLYFLASPLAAVIAFAGFVFYLGVYSVWLKRRTSQNIVIGGAAGAVGPLIGYAAITNTLDGSSWLLFALIFFWTPPHFWSLALKYKDDYAQANIPMLPVVVGEEKTRFQILAYTFTLFPVIIGLYMLGVASIPSFITLLALSFVFTYKSWKLYRSHSSVLCMDVFHYSCLYLFGLFCVITMDRLLVLF